MACPLDGFSTALLMLMLCGSGACLGDSESIAVTDHNARSVELIEEGKGPLRELVFNLRPGTRQAAKVQIVSVAKGSQGSSGVVPGLETTIGATVESIRSDGAAVVALRARTAMLKREGMSSEMYAKMQKVFSQAGETALRKTISSQGFVLGSEVMAAEGGNPGKSIEFSSVPLPERPVGVGARWKVTERLKGDRTTVKTYLLRSIDGNRVECDVTISGESAGGGKGMRSHSSGSGRVVLDLALPMPVSVAIHVVTVSEWPDDQSATGSSVRTVEVDINMERSE